MWDPKELEKLLVAGRNFGICLVISGAVNIAWRGEATLAVNILSTLVMGLIILDAVYGLKGR